MIASLLVAVMVTFKTGAEVCDDGNQINTDACVNCALPRCGDGFVRTDVGQGLQATRPTMGISQTPARAQALALKRSAVMGSLGIFRKVAMATKLVMTTMESKRMLV